MTEHDEPAIAAKATGPKVMAHSQTTSIPSQAEADGQQNRIIDILLSCFGSAGLKSIVTSPGYRNTPMLAAAHHRAAQFELHSHLDERSAGFFALGLARATARPVMLCCTSGSAGAHYLPAVMEAWHQGCGLLIVTADRPPELHDVGAAQTTDQSQLFAQHTLAYFDLDPWAIRLDDTLDPEAAPTWFTRKLNQLWQRAHAGPVHINLRLRKPLVYVPSSKRTQVNTDAATQSDLRSSFDRTLSADAPWKHWRHPAIVLGPHVERPSEVYTLLQEHAQVPHCLLQDIASDVPMLPQRKVAEQLGDTLKSIDGVLWLGGWPTRKISQQFLQTAYDAGIPICTAHRQNHPLDPKAISSLNIQTAPDIALENLLTSIPHRHHHQPSEPIQPKTVYGASNPASAPFTAAKVMHHLSARWSGDIVSSNSLVVRDLDRHGHFQSGQRIWVNRGLSGIDGTVAMAAGIAHHQGPTLLFCGDVALAHDLGSWLNLAEQKLCLVLIDNQGGQIFSKLPIDTALFTAMLQTPPALPYKDLSTAVGYRYEAIETPKMLYALEPQPGMFIHAKVISLS